MAVDDELAMAAQLLLRDRFVLREEDPEGFFLVRRHERALREFFREKLGWTLLMNMRFYKLEKVPAAGAAYLGIEAMQGPEDYALLACTLAFLEEQEVDGQFLLSRLLEVLPGLYPADAPLAISWESYAWRRALIRVMKYLEAERLIRVVDDESEGFLSAGLSGGAPAGEALYEVTVLSRYFLRLFARNLRSYHDVMLLGETGEEGLDVRRRVYRQLLLAPVFYRTAATEEEFSYLRHQHREIDAKCQQWFGLSLELYDDAALLVCEEPPSLFAELYPSARRGLHDIMLQFAAAWRARGDAAAHRDATRTELVALLARLREAYGENWTKEYREMAPEALFSALLPELVDWCMAEEREDGLYRLLPALWRLAGGYEEKGEAS